MPRLFAYLLGCTLSLPSLATVISSEISENSAKFIIAEGANSVELTLEFESVRGLNEYSAGVDSYTFSPSDPNLLGRLPVGVEPVSAFPVMIIIEPPADGGLIFSGAAEVSVYTHDLNFNSNYRVFKSHEGEVFHDLTAEHEPGSYRARLRTGNFSEWIVVKDNRDPDEVIALKYQRLSDAISSSGLHWRVINSLLSQLSLSQFFWQQGNTRLAIALLDVVTGLLNGLVEPLVIDGLVKPLLGEGLIGSLVDRVWGVTTPVTNVVGDLLGASATLRFSLSQR
ncbi:DUF6689 family protein [Microbulbifer pacificus]|uniref:DUF6689 family protein n=1 Tax=Microbulbifer pacificus TaxID=407164 RepID=UPI000CF3E317|nr:DUF6689 family protein [Microbulbifer pacificus]